MYFINMDTWIVLYYETITGECPVQEFIDSLSIRNQAKILNFIELLEQQGPTLPRPYADLLDDSIHELRTKLSGNQVRTFYFFCYQKYIILTHSFIKTTSKVPSSEILKAKKLRDDFLSRYDEKKLQEEFNNEDIS